MEGTMRGKIVLEEEYLGALNAVFDLARKATAAELQIILTLLRLFVSAREREEGGEHE